MSDPDIEEMREQFRGACSVDYDLTASPECAWPLTDRVAYLCGPINGCTDEEANEWRSKVKALWPGPTRDPMRRDYRGREAESVREIVELDKIDVASSDVLIVSYDKPSVGTSMEVIWAWERGKPVVVIHRPDVSLSPWLVYHSHARVHDYGAAVEAALALVGSR